MLKWRKSVLFSSLGFLISAAPVSAAPPGAEGEAARQRAIEAAVMSSVYSGSEESDRSGVQIGWARRMMWMQRLRETLAKDLAMRKIPPGAPRDGAAAPPAGAAGAQGPGGPPPSAPPAGAKRRGPNRQTVALHVDNAGYDSTGVWREGIFYANRDLTGNGDWLMANYIRAQGLDSLSFGYSIPIGKRTSLDLDYLTNTVEIIGSQRAREIQGHAYSFGANIRHTLRADRAGRTEAGLFLSHSHLVSDMGNRPMLGTRARALDSNVNRYEPYVSFAHYGDSSMIWHRHSVSAGTWNDIKGSHKGYTSYRMNLMYEKSYSHGQKITGRAEAQLSDREGLSSADRFYIGGIGSVRGYKENHISGDNGFSAGLEYHVPLEPKRELSAFAFFDYGRVSGGIAPVHSEMIGVGAGLAYDVKDIHATLTLGFPLKREVGVEGDRDMSRTRIHFMIHAMF